MEEYQERVVAEKSELDEKLEKLKAFLSTVKFTTLPVLERNLLVRQAREMSDYSETLRRRIELFPA